MTHVAGIKVDSSCLVVLVVRHCNHLLNPDCKLVVYNKDVLPFYFASVGMLILKYGTLLLIKTFNYFPFGTDFGNFFYTFLAVVVLNNGFESIEMADDTQENPVFSPRFIVILDLFILFVSFIILYRSCP